MSAHTKGPWEYEKECATVYSYHGFRIADIPCAFAMNEPVQEANARLIAAAPDLLEAASDAYSRLLSLGDYTGRFTMKGQSELASLVDAIAKATGRENQEVQEEFEEREIMRKYK